jgi:hypothetical protein
MVKHMMRAKRGVDGYASSKTPSMLKRQQNI